jgi:hypothetical protein
MRRTKAWPFLLPPAALILLGFVFFSSTGRDDAHITFWPAHTLATRGEIVNYNGERVEQSSSLLLVGLLALLAKGTGLAVPTLGSLVSILSGAAAAIGGQRVALRRNRGSGLFAGLLVATSASFVYWAFSGLETTLASLLGLWLVLSVAGELDAGAAARPSAGTLAAMACFALSRPEAGIVAIVMLATTLAARWHARRRGGDDPSSLGTTRKLGLLLALAALLFVAIGAGRFAYFGSFFPQPVAAKSAGLNPYAMIGGARYLLRHGVASTLLPVIVLAAAGTISSLARSARGPVRDPLALVAAAYLTAGTAFILASGGDWMEGGRFLVPLWPVAAIVATDRLEGMSRPRPGQAMAAALVSLQVVGVLVLARTASTGSPAWAAIPAGAPAADREFSWFERTNRIHRRDIPVLTTLRGEVERIASQRPGRVRIMSGQMGLVPFHLGLSEFGRIRMLDTRGLTDRALSSCPVTSGASRSSIGLVLSYGFYFAHLDELGARCGLAAPDIVYDLGEYYDDVIAHGYVPVYREVGAVASGSEAFPGDRLDRGEFIAVRRDLVDASAAVVAPLAPGYDGTRVRGLVSSAER